MLGLLVLAVLVQALQVVEIMVLIAHGQMLRQTLNLLQVAEVVVLQKLALLRLKMVVQVAVLLITL